MLDISRLVAKTYCTIISHWNKGEIHQRSNCRMYTVVAVKQAIAEVGERCYVTPYVVTHQLMYVKELRIFFFIYKLKTTLVVIIKFWIYNFLDRQIVWYALPNYVYDTRCTHLVGVYRVGYWSTVSVSPQLRVETCNDLFDIMITLFGF